MKKIISKNIYTPIDPIIRDPTEFNSTTFTMQPRFDWLLVARDLVATDFARVYNESVFFIKYNQF